MDGQNSQILSVKYGSRSLEWKPVEARRNTARTTFNQWVAGSNPARLTNQIKGLERIGRRRPVMGRAQGTHVSRRL